MGTSSASSLSLESVQFITGVTLTIMSNLTHIGEFQQDQLWTSDPKALQRIFHASAYRYPKLQINRVLAQMLNGRGIVWADGVPYCIQ